MYDLFYDLCELHAHLFIFFSSNIPRISDVDFIKNLNVDNFITYICTQRRKLNRSKSSVFNEIFEFILMVGIWLFMLNERKLFTWRIKFNSSSVQSKWFFIYFYVKADKIIQTIKLPIEIIWEIVVYNRIWIRNI